MKKVLIVLYFVAILGAGSLSAQSFSISQDSVTGVNNGREAEYVLKTNISNLLSNRPISVKWERYENTYANGWLGNQICVYGNCYYYDVDTGPIVIAASSTESFDAHFGNDFQSGSGSMRVRFYEPNDSAGTLKNVYFGATINVPPVGIAKPLNNVSSADFQIFPNPAKDFIIVKRPDASNISRIEVYNMLGLKVITQHTDQNNIENRIDLLDLQKGVYMIRVFDKSNNVILTKSISKIR
jgi:hypothetical protein